MNYVRIGKRTLNLDSVSYTEVQVWQDEMTVKVYFGGSANNTPLVLPRTMPRNCGNIWSMSQRNLSHKLSNPLPHSPSVGRLFS